MFDLRKMTEQRAVIGTKAQAIVKQAESEKRALTATEQRDFDTCMAEFDAITAQIDLAKRSGSSNRAMQNIDLGTSTERATGDTRALDNGESVRSFVESRIGHTSDNIGFGQFIRASVLGPRTDAERRALSAGSDSAGGYLVNDYLAAQVIDRLRPQAQVMKAGAQVVPLLTDRHSFAKISADPAATWRAENGSVAVADATFSQVLFQPKTLAVIVKASRELLEDSLNINEALEAVFAGAFATELDRVALVGASANSEPVGIHNFTGVNSVSMGTDGGSIASYAKLLDAVYEVEADNASVNAAIMNPRTARALNGLTDSTEQPLRKPDALANVPFLSTTSVPVDQTQGLATDASSIYVGDFSKLWIGVRTSLRIEVLKERYADTLSYGFLAYLRADVQATHENAFCKLIGIIPGS